MLQKKHHTMFYTYLLAARITGRTRGIIHSKLLGAGTSVKKQDENALFCSHLTALFFNHESEWKHGSWTLPPPDELLLLDRLGGEDLVSGIPRLAQSTPKEPVSSTFFVMRWIHTKLCFDLLWCYILPKELRETLFLTVSITRETALVKEVAESLLTFTTMLQAWGTHTRAASTVRIQACFWR